MPKMVPKNVQKMLLFLKQAGGRVQFGDQKMDIFVDFFDDISGHIFYTVSY